MKKLLFSLVAAAATCTVNAADFGITAGVGAAKIANEDCDAVVAYNVGAKANIDITENLFVEGAALFQHQGFAFKADVGILDLLSYSKTYTYDLYYLSVPVNIGWNFNITDNFGIAPKLGLTFSAGLFGHQSDWDCDPFSDRKDNPSAEVHSYATGHVFDNFNRFNLGLNLGANFNIAKQFQVGVQYTHGLSEISSDIDDSEDRIITANFAYFF